MSSSTIRVYLRHANAGSEGCTESNEWIPFTIDADITNQEFMAQVSQRVDIPMSCLCVYVSSGIYLYPVEDIPINFQDRMHFEYEMSDDHAYRFERDLIWVGPPSQEGVQQG